MPLSALLGTSIHPDLPAWAVELFWVAYAVLVTGMILLERRRPTATMAWVLALVFIPLLGLAAYWLFGRRRVTRRRRRRGRQGVRALDDSRAMANIEHPPSSVSEVQAGLIRLALRTAAAPLRRTDTLELLTTPTAAWEKIRAAIVGATRCVHLEFYIWKDDETGRALTRLLTERARAGVRVRVLYDQFGSIGLPDAHFDELRRAGGQIAGYGPLRFPIPSTLQHVNFRNHRKIITVDTDVGFVGGLNVGDEYLGRDTGGNTWRDLQLHMTGDGVIGLRAIFAEDWLTTTGQVLDLSGRVPPGLERKDGRLPPLPSAPATAPAPSRRSARRIAPHEHPFDPPPDTPVCSKGPLLQIIASGPDTEVADTIALQMHAALASARTRAWIATPYFIPDTALSLVLRTAALRGVDVRILLPSSAHSDQRLVAAASRSYYDELLQAGCRIYEYQAGMLHAKALIVDHDVCTIGSANMDIRSFYVNYEVTAMIYDTTITDGLAAVFLRDLDKAQEISAASRGDRPMYMRLAENFARVLSPIM